MSHSVHSTFALVCITIFKSSWTDLKKSVDAQDGRGEKCGCAPIPYYLLSSLDMYTPLLSSARTTNCTSKTFPLFLKPPATGTWCLAHTKEDEIPQKLCKTGNLSELMRSALSRLPPKETRPAPPPNAIIPARDYNHKGLKERLSRREDFSSAKALIL